MVCSSISVCHASQSIPHVLEQTGTDLADHKFSLLSFWYYHWSKYWFFTEKRLEKWLQYIISWALATIKLVYLKHFLERFAAQKWLRQLRKKLSQTQLKKQQLANPILLEFWAQNCKDNTLNSINQHQGTLNFSALMLWVVVYMSS